VVRRIAVAFGFACAVSVLGAGEGCSGSITGQGAADGSVEASTIHANAQSDKPIACTSRYDCTPLGSLLRRPTSWSWSDASAFAAISR
jgi:hypothetical protein